jgi:hypothetical protein
VQFDDVEGARGGVVLQLLLIGPHRAGRLHGRACAGRIRNLPVKARGRQVRADPEVHPVNRLGQGWRFESPVRHDMIGLIRAEVEARFQVYREESGLAPPRQAAWPDVEKGEAAMIGYAMLGTNDVEASSKFYDRLFAVIGAKRLMEFRTGPAYGVALDRPMLAICTPDDGASAFAGNGTMIALTVPNKQDVDRLHAMALKLGGKDVMAPGYIDPENPDNRAFYGARFLDLDGNRLSVFCKAPA